jgi:hypothetical protein
VGRKGKPSAGIGGVKRGEDIEKVEREKERGERPGTPSNSVTFEEKGNGENLWRSGGDMMALSARARVGVVGWELRR